MATTTMANDPEPSRGGDVPVAAEHVVGDIPNPGSDAALKLGCKCPVLDNARGNGYYGVPGRFAINADCPVHGHA